jgi:hypothetical protein
MQNAAVLDIRAGTDGDKVNIPPDGDERPDADIIGHSDITNDHATGIDHHTIAFLGEQIFIRTQYCRHTYLDE